jgi:alcohol dehydrogenase class IV
MNIRALRERTPGNETLRRYDEVARLLTGQPQATADDGVKWVAELVRDLEIPSLATYGIGAPHISQLIANAANASSMKANPVVLTYAELAEVLQSAADL